MVQLWVKGNGLAGLAVLAVSHKLAYQLFSIAWVEVVNKLFQGGGLVGLAYISPLGVVVFQLGLVGLLVVAKLIQFIPSGFQ
jgi:hypothetical protein